VLQRRPNKILVTADHDERITRVIVITDGTGEVQETVSLYQAGIPLTQDSDGDGVPDFLDSDYEYSIPNIVDSKWYNEW